MVDGATPPANTLKEALALASNAVNYQGDHSPPISRPIDTGGCRRFIISSLLA